MRDGIRISPYKEENRATGGALLLFLISCFCYMQYDDHIGLIIGFFALLVAALPLFITKRAIWFITEFGFIAAAIASILVHITGDADGMLLLFSVIMTFGYAIFALIYSSELVRLRFKVYL